MAERTRREEGKREGAALIAEKAETLPSSPGVYRMLGKASRILYVGKARNLKKRVEAYRKTERHSARIARMITLTREMEFTLTRSESEALLLEAAMIKREKPPFNIIMRDDKSFPYIALLKGRYATRLAKYRGAQKEEGSYFGPFISARVVEQALHALQRGFLLRSCRDTVYANRSRPCLLYQIKRCSAPCTGEISEKDYEALASEARLFLEGKSREVQKRLSGQMDEAAAAMDFERAALARDRLRALERIRHEGAWEMKGVEEADLFALHREGGVCCIELYIIRGGRTLGNRAYFPKHDKEEKPAQILSAFLGQFYEKRKPPPRILLTEKPSDMALLEKAFHLLAGRRVKIQIPQRGRVRDLSRQALANAKAALARRRAERAQQAHLLESLAKKLDLPTPLERIEIYDNSHIQGALPVGAMVVAGAEGFMKKSYRLFHMRDAAAFSGDDYAMMREVFRRRFGRLLREKEEASASAPDLIILDGGGGQISSAREALHEIGAPHFPILGIAKGPDRHAGRERFFFGKKTFTLGEGEALLYYLQRLRDEAHRFAVAGHRSRRKKSLSASPLDSVSGIGQARKSAILRHFGSAKEALRASPSELASVRGISERLAKKIHEEFHGDEAG